jgi:hypothetical protein
MNFPSTSPVGGSNHEFEVIVDEAIERVTFVPLATRSRYQEPHAEEKIPADERALAQAAGLDERAEARGGARRPGAGRGPAWGVPEAARAAPGDAERLACVITGLWGIKSTLMFYLFPRFRTVFSFDWLLITL